VRGTPGHGSMPFRSDNAAVKAGEIVRRIAAYHPPRRLDGLWRRFVDGLGLRGLQRLALKSPLFVGRALDRAPIGIGRMFDASTHTTFSPNFLRSGIKINVIPDTAEIEVDIRVMPGDDGEPVRRMLAEAIGDLWPECEIASESVNAATTSPLDTPLWDLLDRVSAQLVPDARTVPMLLVGATDARFFRRKGIVAYGYGLLSERIPFNEFAAMFHGNDERVDQESLRLSAELWERVAREFLG